MNKISLVAAVAEQLGMTKKETDRVITCALDTIADAVAAGERVQLAGFGVFELKERPARRGYNPSTGETIELPARQTPAFRAGKGLKEKVEKQHEAG